MCDVKYKLCPLSMRLEINANINLVIATHCMRAKNLSSLAEERGGERIVQVALNNM